MVTFDVNVLDERIILTASSLPLPESITLSNAERALATAGFDYVRIPADLPRVLRAPNSTLVTRLGETNFDSLKEIEMVLVKLNGRVAHIDATVADVEYRAFIPKFPDEIVDPYAELIKNKSIAELDKFVLMLPEWDQRPKDPMLLVGDLSNGYLYNLGAWGTPAELERFEQFARKRLKH